MELLNNSAEQAAVLHREVRGVAIFMCRSILIWLESYKLRITRASSGLTIASNHVRLRCCYNPLWLI
jgi:hypothetical protein